MLKKASESEGGAIVADKQSFFPVRTFSSFGIIRGGWRRLKLRRCMRFLMQLSRKLRPTGIPQKMAIPSPTQVMMTLGIGGPRRIERHGRDVSPFFRGNGLLKTIEDLDVVVFGIWPGT